MSEIYHLKEYLRKYRAATDKRPSIVMWHVLFITMAAAFFMIACIPPSAIPDQMGKYVVLTLTIFTFFFASIAYIRGWEIYETTQ